MSDYEFKPLKDVSHDEFTEIVRLAKRGQGDIAINWRIVIGLIPWPLLVVAVYWFKIFEWETTLVTIALAAGAIALSCLVIFLVMDRAFGSKYDDAKSHLLMLRDEMKQQQKETKRPIREAKKPDASDNCGAGT